MMNEELNMDRYFREKLEGFSQEPPSLVWEGIRDRLAVIHRKRRMAVYRWVAVAAMLVLAFMGGWYFNKRVEKEVNQLAVKEVNIPENQVITDNNEIIRDIPDEKPAESSVYQMPAADIIPARILTAELDIDTYSSIDPSDLPVIEPRRESEDILNVKISKKDPEPFDARETTGQNVENTLVKNEISESDKKLIADNVRFKSQHEKDQERWKLGMNVSPGYSSYSASHEKYYASNMTNNSAGGSSDVSAGISVQYKTAGRWSVESGVYYVQNGQKSESTQQMFAGNFRKGDNTYSLTERLYFNTDMDDAENKMIMNSVAGIVEFDNFPQGVEIETSPEMAANYDNSLVTKGEFSQVFDFIEIPLFLRYLLIDSKVGIELVGGVNAGIIVGNNAFINNEYGLQNIGKTRDISPVNLSASAGLGASYALSKNISLAVEPRINYYLKSINSNPDVNFRPYRIGLYTGLYYEF